MTAATLLEKLPRLRVLVVGDLCLDLWCRYHPSLAIPSAETGIPRVAVTSSESTPGAAGTVANNLKSLGVGRVAVLSAIGDDGHGYEVLRAMSCRDIDRSLVLKDAAIPTFTYTKFINAETGIEDLPRTDFILNADLPESVDTAICRSLRKIGIEFDLICVSDQAETERGGIVTPSVREELAALAAQGILVWVDSRRRIEQFRGGVLKMNEEELRGALERSGLSSPEQIRQQAQASLLYVTLGGNGVRISTERGETRIETRRIPEPVDICGAGDSFTAGAASALACGAEPEAAARMGHLVASVTVMKKGTGTASPAELLRAEQAQSA